MSVNDPTQLVVAHRIGVDPGTPGLGTVTSLAAGAGITLTPNPITASGTVAGKLYTISTQGDVPGPGTNDGSKILFDNGWAVATIPLLPVPASDGGLGADLSALDAGQLIAFDGTKFAAATGVKAVTGVLTAVQFGDENNDTFVGSSVSNGSNATVQAGTSQVNVFDSSTVQIIFGSGREILFQDAGAGFTGISGTAALDIFGFGTVDVAAYKVGGAPGITGTVTTASLIGKTLTFTNGLITGFA